MLSGMSSHRWSVPGWLTSSSRPSIRSSTATVAAGDWEGWTCFFLACVQEAAEDGIQAATRIFGLLEDDRRRLIAHAKVTVPALRLFEILPEHPMVTLAVVTERLDTNKPTATRAIQTLEAAGILREITGKARDRVYAYHAYLAVLGEDTEALSD